MREREINLVGMKKMRENIDGAAAARVFIACRSLHGTENYFIFCFLTSRALYLFRGRLFSLRRCGSVSASRFSDILFEFVERPRCSLPFIARVHLGYNFSSFQTSSANLLVRRLLVSEFDEFPNRIYRCTEELRSSTESR